VTQHTGRKKKRSVVTQKNAEQANRTPLKKAERREKESVVEVCDKN
jgi:hypothetical protein